MPRDFDVAVIGGGAAGVAAALAAARRGAHTLLVERGEALGGNAAHAFVHTICGLYLAADGAGPEIAHPGLPRALAAELVRSGAASAPERAGRVWVLPTDPPRLSRCLAALCARRAGLRVALGHELVGAELASESGETSALTLRSARGAETLCARAVIDASGDAAAAALAGADWDMAPEARLQLPSFIFRIAGVEPGAVEGFARLHLTRAVAGAARTGSLPEECASVLVRPGVDPAGVWVTLNVPRPEPWSPLDEDRLATHAKDARVWAEAVVDFLRATRPAFRAARVSAWPRRLGVRETRRARGVETVGEADVLAGRRRPDEVAVSTWPVELWHGHRRAELRHAEGPSSIPLGALCSRSFPRLAMAGRCVSASHEALGALRVIGTSLATGEAAGVAATLAVDGGCALAALDASRIRNEIVRLASEGPT